MTALVIDASIAVKWLIAENDTPEALVLRGRAHFSAPDLLLTQAAQILWKKVRRSELSANEAQIAVRLLQGMDIELVPTRPLIDTAMRLAVQLQHSPYDCIYLALALVSQHQLVTADAELLRKLGQQDQETLRRAALSLTDAAKTLQM